MEEITKIINLSNPEDIKTIDADNKHIFFINCYFNAQEKNTSYLNKVYLIDNKEVYIADKTNYKINFNNFDSQNHISNLNKIYKTDNIDLNFALYRVLIDSYNDENNCYKYNCDHLQFYIHNKLILEFNEDEELNICYYPLNHGMSENIFGNMKQIYFNIFHCFLKVTPLFNCEKKYIKFNVVGTCIDYVNKIKEILNLKNNNIIQHLLAVEPYIV